VPSSFPSIQEAVSAGKPEDVVLVSPGRYKESVTVQTPNLTIRGTDRNKVLIDGQFARPNGILVQANDLTVENLSVCCNTEKGVIWLRVTGWRGRYLTSFNNGVYGFWALESAGPGVFDHVYASGHPDTGIYIGQCESCDARVVDSLAERNAAGYSGANTTGVTIENSEFRSNSMGVVPNSLLSLKPPATRMVIRDNKIHSNGRTDVPGSGFGAFHGFGIALIGTIEAEVRNNEVWNNGFYGVALVAYPETSPDQSQWQPDRNRIFENRVGSGHSVADLALAERTKATNCFEGNRRKSGDPPSEKPNGLQSSGMWSCDRSTTPSGSDEVESQFWSQVGGPNRPVDYRTSHRSKKSEEKQARLGAGSGDQATGLRNRLG
jgi:hypothetical protein